MNLEKVISHVGNKDGPEVYAAETYLTKSLPISFKHGISVPQYWDRDKIEQSRGTINKASRDSMSKACPISF